MMRLDHNEVGKTSTRFFFFFSTGRTLQIQSLALFVSELEQVGAFARRCVIQKVNKWIKHSLSPSLNHLFWKNDLKDKRGGCYCSLYVHGEH